MSGDCVASGIIAIQEIVKKSWPDRNIISDEKYVRYLYYSLNIT